MYNSKKIILTNILVFVMLFAFTDTQAQILPTKITITVLDRLGNVVEGAEVNLYTSKDNYRASENAVFTGTSDKKGRVKFKNAETRAYFTDARKGDQNNDGQGVQSGKLEAGKVNKINIVIE